MARIEVRVQPGASRDDLQLEGEVLRARLAAPAIEGRANKRLIALLAKQLGVRKSDVVIIRGETARDKLVEIASLDEQDLRRRLGVEDVTLPFPESLCHRCDAPPKYVRTERSVFILCPRMPDKYPRQPVSECAGFRPRSGGTPKERRSRG